LLRPGRATIRTIHFQSDRSFSHTLRGRRAWIENKDNPAEVKRIANELLALEPHLIEMLIAEGEKAPALT
jgi:hypothetical protein